MTLRDMKESIKKAYDPEIFRKQGHAFVDFLANALQKNLTEENTVLNWQEPHEQQEHRQEQPKTAHEREDVDPCGAEVVPAGQQVIPMQAGHDNDKSLEPHADVDKDHQRKYQPRRLANPFNPEELGHDHVARDHGPIGPPVGP